MTAAFYYKIIRGETPSYKIFKDDTVFEFMDINLVTLGYLMVILNL
jgi:diadenosine tetraphosphate (Ap4A) HIT family hydrolase